MRDRRRTTESRPANSQSIVDGSAEAIALGTMAAGLVFGAALKSAAAPADHARKPTDGQAPEEAVATPTTEHTAPPAAAADGKSGPVPMVDQHSGVPDHVDAGVTETAVEPPAAATMATARDAIEASAPTEETPREETPREETPREQAGAPPTTVDTPASPSPVVHEAVGAEPATEIASSIASSLATPQEAIAGVATQIASAMGTLVDQMKALSGEIANVPTLIQQATDIGTIATRMVDDVLAATTQGIEELSEILGGPPLDLGTAVDSLTGDLVPPSILGAPSDATPASEAVQATFNALPVEPVADIGSEVLDHAAMTVTEVAPLQLGFLGQSYVDAHSDDGGPHTLSSPLHGLI